MYGGREVGNIHLLEAFCRQTGGSHRNIKHLGDGGSYRALVFHLVAQHHVVGNDARLAIGGSCQEIEPRLARYGMGKLYGIANGIDVLIRSLQIFVHSDASHLANLQSGFLCQACFGFHANAQQHHVGMKRDARLEMHCQFITFA